MNEVYFEKRKEICDDVINIRKIFLIFENIHFKMYFRKLGNLNVKCGLEL